MHWRARHTMDELGGAALAQRQARIALWAVVVILLVVGGALAAIVMME